jgi:hypothetical protein
LIELAPDGGLRDLADLGTLGGAPSTAPFAWAPTSSGAQPRLLFVGPAPSSSSGTGGLFGIFSTLRPTAPPSGLFQVDIEAQRLEETQPRRLGSLNNVVGPVWKSDRSLFGFTGQNEGRLTLLAIDPTSGTAQDTGARLPAGAGQGAGLAAGWDAAHGRALLLSRSNTSSIGSSNTSTRPPLQAWLVSFTPHSQVGRESS